MLHYFDADLIPRTDDIIICGEDEMSPVIIEIADHQSIQASGDTDRRWRAICDHPGRPRLVVSRRQPARGGLGTLRPTQDVRWSVHV